MSQGKMGGGTDRTVPERNKSLGQSNNQSPWTSNGAAIATVSVPGFMLGQGVISADVLAVLLAVISVGFVKIF